MRAESDAIAREERELRAEAMERAFNQIEELLFWDLENLECDRYAKDDPITCGWKRTVQSVVWVMREEGLLK